METLGAICEVKRVTTGNQQNLTDVQVPKRRDGIVERELPDELILYDPKTDCAFLLNHLSAAIWDLCDGQHTPGGITAKLAGFFAAPQAKVLADVRETIARFRVDGLINAE